MNGGEKLYALFVFEPFYNKNREWIRTIHQHVYHDIIEVCNLLFKSGKKCIYCCDLELTYKMFFSKNDK